MQNKTSLRSLVVKYAYHHNMSCSCVVISILTLVSLLTGYFLSIKAKSNKIVLVPNLQLKKARVNKTQNKPCTAGSQCCDPPACSMSISYNLIIIHSYFKGTELNKSFHYQRLLLQRPMSLLHQSIPKHLHHM